ncbi:MAG: hypothetical protein AB1556_11785 [Bacillota bacterium]
MSNHRIHFFLLLAWVFLFACGCGSPFAGERQKQEDPEQTIPREVSSVKEVAGIRVITGGQKTAAGTVPMLSFAVVGGAAEIPAGVWDYPARPEKMFSPDGRWVAFTGRRAGSSQGLWAVTLDGA